MPKLLPHELYAAKLSHLNLGYALFEPDPNNAYDRIRVGDVGYISEDGKFIKLFNAFHDKDALENQAAETPATVEPIAEKFRKLDSPGPLPPGLRLSESVRSVGGNLSIQGPILQVAAGASVRLSCTTRCGAALITKDFATRQKALSSKAMEDYMVANCLSWLQLARGLGRPVELHDLIFVRECILTGDWASIAWDKSSCSAQISFSAGISGIADVALSYWGNWEDHIDVPKRQGPLRLGLNREEYSLTNFDQCIFLKGIRIAHREWYKRISSFLKVIGTEAENLDGPSSLSIVQLLRRYGFKIETVGSSKSSFRPVQYAYDVVAIFILEGSDADVAVIDDNDLASFQFVRDAAGSLEEICDAAQEYKYLSVTVFTTQNSFKVGRICWSEPEPSVGSTDNLILLDEDYKEVHLNTGSDQTATQSIYNQNRSGDMPEFADVLTPESFRLTGGRPVHTITCDSCKGHRQCERSQTNLNPLASCRYCNSHGISCTTSSNSEPEPSAELDEIYQHVQSDTEPNISCRDPKVRFKHYDTEILHQTAGKPVRTMACDSCREGHHKCERWQIKPLTPCRYCAVRRIPCITSSDKSSVVGQEPIL